MNSYAAVWNRLITIISRDDPLLPPVIFSVFAFARGIGSILSGPISTALLKKGGLGHAAFGYGVGDYVSVHYENLFGLLRRLKLLITGRFTDLDRLSHRSRQCRWRVIQRYVRKTMPHAKY